MNGSTSMGIRRALLSGGAALVLVLAACGDDGGNGDDTAAGTTSSGIVGTRDVDGFGSVLVDTDGNTLYTTAAEDDGTVRCVDGCADFWPPLAATAEDLPSEVEGVDGEFGVVDRPDGSEQLTLDGNPLYTFADDSGPGSVAGDGVEDDFQGTHFVWHAVTVEGDGSGDSPAEDDGNGGYGY